MKKAFILIILVFFLKNIQSQVIPDWSIDYIIKNKIKSITTLKKKLINSKYNSWEEKIEKFDKNGKLIFTHDFYNNSDHYFYYDSLQELVSEKIVVNKKDSITHEYHTVYQNGKLIQKIFIAKRASFSYTYDKNMELIKETYNSGDIADNIFGTSFSFSTFQEFNSYEKMFFYIKNKTCISTIYDSNKYLDTLEYNTKKNLIKKKTGGIFPENIKYKYKSNQLKTIEIRNCKYYYSYSKNLIHSIISIDSITSVNNISDPLFLEFKYGFW